MVTGHILIILYTVPGLVLNNTAFPNHGVIKKDPLVIGEGVNALSCVTDDTTCCGTPPSADCCGTPSSDGGSGNERGHWYFPNGVQLESGTANEFLWYARWLTGAVLMNFRGTATTGSTGLHRCDIRDSTGTLHQFYTCVYVEAGDNINIFSCKCMAMIMYHLCIHVCLSFVHLIIIAI